MMGNDLTAAPCYCCNDRPRPRGAQRMQERREWIRDASSGERDESPEPGRPAGIPGESTNPSKRAACPQSTPTTFDDGTTVVDV